VTEHSYKYTLSGFRRLAGRAGYAVTRVWTDPRRGFGVHYLTPGPEKANGDREGQVLARAR
jgi:L-histidine Nalpha-methyltransferase